MFMRVNHLHSVLDTNLYVVSAAKVKCLLCITFQLVGNMRIPAIQPSANITILSSTQSCWPEPLLPFYCPVIKESVLYIKAMSEDSLPYISFWSESFRTLIHLIRWLTVSASPEMARNVPNIQDHLDHIKWWYHLDAIMSKWLPLHGVFISLCFMHHHPSIGKAIEIIRRLENILGIIMWLE